MSDYTVTVTDPSGIAIFVAHVNPAVVPSGLSRECVEAVLEAALLAASFGPASDVEKLRVAA